MEPPAPLAAQAKPVAIYTHAACLVHDPGPGHAERPARLLAVTEALRAAFPGMLDWREAPRVSRGDLLRVHAAALLHTVLETRPAQRVMLDPDTVLSPGSAEAALRAAGAAVAAVDAVIAGNTARAFCAVRPPGHHATADTAMGFCLFNNIAVAAAHALAMHGLERVAIADFDVQHGNGALRMLPTPRSFARPVSGYSGDWCELANNTRGSCSKIAWVPLPWCTSKSAMATRSSPCIASACAAATAILLNRQNPIAVSAVA